MNNSTKRLVVLALVSSSNAGMCAGAVLDGRSPWFVAELALVVGLALGLLPEALSARRREIDLREADRRARDAALVGGSVRGVVRLPDLPPLFAEIPAVRSDGGAR
jgi:hypothetical protein